MPVNSLALILGPEVFLDFEIPEQIGDIGGTQVVAQHDFPGGIRTQQLFGAFPAPIQWSGTFTGFDALARMREVDRLRVAGREVQLSFGNTILSGVVSEFTARPRHQWLIPYTIKFMPRVDQAAITPLDQILSSLSLINKCIGKLSTLLSVIAAPGSTGPTLTNLPPTEIYMPMPPTLVQPTFTLIDLTNAALINSMGIVEDISRADAQAIYDQAATVTLIANDLGDSVDPVISSPALDTVGWVAGIVTGVSAPTSQIADTVAVINPNLYRMAAQYYGDATKWQTIASASGIIPPDPMPLGEFTLVIPATAA